MADPIGFTPDSPAQGNVKAIGTLPDPEGFTPDEPKDVFPSSDIARIKGSFADPATRQKLQTMAFTKHPINWLEAHAGGILPSAGMMAGGTLGGAAGAIEGIPAGPAAIATGYAGAVAGAGAGSAAGESLRARIGKYLGVNDQPIGPQAVQAGEEGAVGEAIGKPVMGGLKYVGKTLYNSPLRPVIEQALREGKEGIENVFYKGGIKTPWNLTSKAQDLANNIQAKSVTPVLQQAEDQGAVLDMNKALKPLRDLRDTEAAIRTPESQEAASAAQQKISYYDQAANGTPGTPPTMGEKPTGILDMNGKPITRPQVTSPGSPGTPPQPYGPMEAVKVKTRQGWNVPVNQATPLQQRVQNAAYAGFKNASEDSVASSLGEPAAQGLRNANSDIGKIISTQSGQATVENQSNRMLENLTSLRGTDAFAAAMGAGYGHTLESALTGFGLKKAVDAARVLQMPAGYAMRKFAESPTLSQGTMSLASPWLKMQLDKQGGSQ